jgi:CubicO group peptidase (beta-lactamase class C family)
LAGLVATGCSLRETGAFFREPQGLRAESLAQLRSRLQAQIEAGFAPGLVGLVARGSEVETIVAGKMAFGGDDDMRLVSDVPATGKWSRQPRFEQGDVGLVSTVDDYLAFARMLLADGQHRGRTLLAPSSVKAMTTNHLAASQRAGGAEILFGGRGWGYGLSVVVDMVPGQPAPGSFGWNGGFGSSYISDPTADLTMILMTQREFTQSSGDPIHREFQADAYRAMAYSKRALPLFARKTFGSRLNWGHHLFSGPFS